MTVKVNSQLIECYIPTPIGLVSITCINVKATPTNNTIYSCDIEAVKLVYPIISPSHTASHC